MSRGARKLVLGVSDQVRNKLTCAGTEESQKLEIWDLRRLNFTIRVAKTKALISFAVTAKLICVFVFAYAKIPFSHDAAHMIAKCMWHCSDNIAENAQYAT